MPVPNCYTDIIYQYGNNIVEGGGNIQVSFEAFPSSRNMAPAESLLPLHPVASHLRCWMPHTQLDHAFAS